MTVGKTVTVRACQREFIGGKQSSLDLVREDAATRRRREVLHTNMTVRQCVLTPWRASWYLNGNEPLKGSASDVAPWRLKGNESEGQTSTRNWWNVPLNMENLEWMSELGSVLVVVDAYVAPPYFLPALVSYPFQLSELATLCLSPKGFLEYPEVLEN